MTRDVTFLDDQPRGAEVLATVCVSVGPDPGTGRPPGLDALYRALAIEARARGGNAIVGLRFGPCPAPRERDGRPARLYGYGAAARLGGRPIG